MSVQPIGNADLPEVRGTDAQAVRETANEKRAELLRREIAANTQLAAMKADMERQRAELEADFRRREQELMAQMKPMLAELDRMKQVIHTVDLYLGRSEEMELLRDGEPAGAEEQIVVRQRVLAADEESLVLVDSGGVDARSMDAFLEWVAASMENTARLLPEPKCVVAVVPSRQSRDYKDPWLNEHMGHVNAQTHWLFRNGEKLWVMTTDFTAGQVITPRHDEFTSFFESRDFHGIKTTLVPGSDAWLKAEEAAGARKRHYMKIGMILQGVLDRTEVFAPLPEGGVNILTAAQAELQQVRFINELDMVLTDGREPFRTWQKRLNAQLQTGMRIVGAFTRYSGDFHDLYMDGDRWSRGHHPRLTPGSAEYPATGTIYPIEGRNAKGEMVIRYVRTEKIEKRNVPVPGKPGYVYRYPQEVEAKNRASAVILPDDSWVLPYDLASLDDLNYYLNHRDARKDYLSMVPIIRAAIEAKQAERDAEAPFRQLLVGTLAAEHGMDLDEVERLLPEVVDRWKLGNRHHRALTGDDAHEQKALRGVRAEFAATLNARHGGTNDTVLQVARATFGDRLLALLSKRDGTYLAIARSVPENNPFNAGWVDTMAITKTGIAKPISTWTTVQARTLSRGVIVWSDEAWATWKQADPARDLTGPELADGVQRVLAAAAAQHPDRVVPAVTVKLVQSNRPARTVKAILHTPGDYKEWPDDVALRWSRTSGGELTWGLGGRSGSNRYSGTVTVGGVTYTGDGCFPWVDESNGYHHDQSRSRLAWLDPEAFAIWMADTDAHMEERRAAKKADEEFWRAQHEWIARHEPLFEEHLRIKAHEAFVEEFGPNAEDLFDHWLTHTFRSREARRKVHDLTVGREWVASAGRTVGELSTGDVSPLIADYRFPPLATPTGEDVA